MRARAGLSACLLLALLLVSAAPEIARPPIAAGGTLEILDLDRGGGLAGRLALDAAGTFTLVFTHSMYGGAVAERYEVVGEPAPGLRRTTIRAETAGAAEYYAYYGNFRRDGDGWLVEAAPLHLASLPLRVDRVGSPLVRSGAAQLSLLEIVPNGHLVELRPRQGDGTRSGDGATGRRGA